MIDYDFLRVGLPGGGPRLNLRILRRFESWGGLGPEGVHSVDFYAHKKSTLSATSSGDACYSACYDDQLIPQLFSAAKTGVNRARVPESLPVSGKRKLHWQQWSLQSARLDRILIRFLMRIKRSTLSARGPQTRLGKSRHVGDDGKS